MSIVLKQSAGAFVTPTDDARLYNLMIGNQSGIVEGITVNHLGANQLKVTAGWGVCQGRQFVVEEEIINASVATSGTMNGRVLIHIDVSSENPISFITQAAVTLPELIKEDINGSGTIYEIALATYTVTEIAINNLVPITNSILSAMQKAEAAMPKSGGDMTGALKTMVSPVDTTEQARNMVVYPAGTDISTVNVSAGTIICILK